MSKLLNDVAINGIAIQEHIQTLQKMLDDDDYVAASIRCDFLLHNLKDCEDALLCLQYTAQMKTEIEKYYRELL